MGCEVNSMYIGKRCKNNTKVLAVAFLMLTSLFTFVTPMQTSTASPGPHTPTIALSPPISYALEDLPFITVDDPLANTSNATRQTVQVTVTSTLDPVGITIILRETTPSSHIFENNATVLSNYTSGIPFGSTRILTINDPALNTNPNTIQTVNARLRSFDPLDTNFFRAGAELNPYVLQETGVNTGVFSRSITFTTVTSDLNNQLLTVPGDIIIAENLNNGRGLNYLITPNTNPSVGVLAVAQGNTIFASYPGAVTDSATITVVGGARPILTLPDTTGGGGGDVDPPSFTLSRSSLPSLMLPENILNTILNSDPFMPIMPLNYSTIDFPLSIDGNGFILTQYANTIKTQTAKTGESTQLKLILSDHSGIGHVGLYTNIPGSSGEIQHSDTYIIYDKSKQIEITDPHGLFYNVTLTTSKEGAKHEFLYNITFAKPMDTSDIIIRTWDEKRNSADTKIFDAIKVVGEPIVDPRVANLDLVATTDIIIPYYKFPRYTTLTSDSDGNLIYHNSFGDMEQKQVHPYHAPVAYPNSVSRLERHDAKQLHDTIAYEQKKATELMISKFNLDTSQTFVPNDEVKPYDESRRASELDLCGKSVGCALDRENNDLMQELCWKEHLRAEKTLKLMTRNNYQDD